MLGQHLDGDGVLSPLSKNPGAVQERLVLGECGGTKRGDVIWIGRKGVCQYARRLTRHLRAEGLHFDQSHQSMGTRRVSNGCNQIGCGEIP